jgi:hypothetical protein
MFGKREKERMIMKRNHLWFLAVVLIMFALASCFNPIGFYSDAALAPSSGDSYETTGSMVVTKTAAAAATESSVQIIR